ncbi:haloacid dehalogenase type II [Paraburkholderia youngii]|uniref:Haloacid dehalogenase type II n=1 Tax=Paraburkholderia youngii TaxID=2782701 RepID=A0ABX2NL49_9BURK|nr:haloacid dehalogenase type II [Paraburkholderia youngii]NUX56724.1 haloacid dehalogenase type II [Paraburkholderia youngii]NVI05154.1 haloacid dehalogenase type II [Paraburkholderia youngii]
MITVRALLFDTFGTVVDWRGGLISRLDEWRREREIAADWPRLVDAWRMAYPLSLQRVRTGEREWAVLDELQRESLERLALEQGVAGLDGAAADEMVRMWHELPPWPESVAALHRLRARYVIAPLSNGHVALLVRMAKTAGLPWDAIFGADIFRHYKPDPETYLGASALLGCQPHEVMLVASHPSDLDAAAKCGLRTCYVSRPLEYGAGRVFEAIPEPARFDLMVDGLEELASELGC